jgi:hypothetical protein
MAVKFIHPHDETHLIVPLQTELRKITLDLTYQCHSQIVF